MLVTNDPGSSDFGGPYTPALAASAGELSTTADAQSMSFSLRFRPVQETADGSRIEIDFGNEAGTDRNNSLIIEHTGVEGTGLRIAVSEPGTTADSWSNDSGVLYDFDFATGYRTLAADIDPTAFHTLSARVVFGDGQNDDVIEIFLDGEMIGTSTTFENYRDFHLRRGEPGEPRVLPRGGRAEQSVRGRRRRRQPPGLLLRRRRLSGVRRPERHRQRTRQRHHRQQRRQHPVRPCRQRHADRRRRPRHAGRRHRRRYDRGGRRQRHRDLRGRRRRGFRRRRHRIRHPGGDGRRRGRHGRRFGRRRQLRHGGERRRDRRDRHRDAGHRDRRRRRRRHPGG